MSVGEGEQVCLLEARCVPCEGGTPPLTEAEWTPLLTQLEGWDLVDNKRLRKTFATRNFVETMAFANRIAEVAEAEGHHPDLHLSFRKTIVELTTHAIGGLSVNDFILAAKIDSVR